MNAQVSIKQENNFVKINAVFRLPNYCYICNEEFSETKKQFPLQKYCRSHQKCDYDKDTLVENLFLIHRDEETFETYKQYCTDCFEKVFDDHLNEKNSIIIAVDDDFVIASVTCPFCAKRQQIDEINEKIELSKLMIWIPEDSVAPKLYEKMRCVEKDAVTSFKTPKIYCPEINCEFSCTASTIIDCKLHGKKCSTCWKSCEDLDNHACDLFPAGFTCKEVQFSRCNHCLIGIENIGGCKNIFCTNCFNHFNPLGFVINSRIYRARYNTDGDLYAFTKGSWRKLKFDEERIVNLSSFGGGFRSHTKFEKEDSLSVNKSFQILDSDVELVMQQTNTTSEQARRALVKNDGDIVNAIMELTV